MPTDPARPELWRALSSAALVIGIVGLIVGASFAWWALIASGVFFGVELLIARQSR